MPAARCTPRPDHPDPRRAWQPASECRASAACRAFHTREIVTAHSERALDLAIGRWRCPTCGGGAWL